MPAPKDPIKRERWIEGNRQSHLGKIPWNKGLPSPQKGTKRPPFSQEWRENMSKAAQGKSSPFKNKKHTEEAKRALSIAASKRVGELNSFFGRTHSKKTREILSSYCGSKASGYVDGNSFLPYCYKFNKRRKRKTREFFGACICCGKTGVENILHKRKGGFVVKDLMVHHIDHDKEQGCSGKPFNLVPLCSRCHSLENAHREEYRHHINKTLEQGFLWGIWSRQEYIEQVMYGE